MNVTLQTNNFNSGYKYNNNSHSSNKISGLSTPSFKGGIDVPTESALFNPLKKALDKFTTGLSEKYTEKLYTSKLAKYLADKADKFNVVNHMQVIGSVIISGMYMTETLRNKQLDDDRKKTLALNQGLTFVLATLGSYTIDSKLANTWEKLMVKYASSEMNEKDLVTKLKDFNAKEKAEFMAKQQNGLIPKDATFKSKKVLDYVSEKFPNTTIEARLKGMSVLKSLLIFGTVYRFLSPVAVTPLATWIGNKFIHNHKVNNNEQPKDEKSAQKTDEPKKS